MMRSLALAAAMITLGAGALMAQTPRTLLFAHDSARITEEHSRLLDEAAQEYRTTGSSAVSIVGHTDTSGSAEYNEELSRRRAEAASDALVQRGVPGASITAAWRGQNDLAVPTADGVREPANRRVELMIAAPAAAPTAAPAPVVEERDRFRILAAPFGAWNIEPDDNSAFLGVNVTASYDITPTIVISAEQAGFYSAGSDDEGFGGRSAGGIDFQIDAFGGLLPYVGANGGYTYVDGSATGGWFAGPELGLRYEGFELKVAYDIYVDDDDRDIEDGVLAVTVGYGLRF